MQFVKLKAKIGTLKPGKRFDYMAHEWIITDLSSAQGLGYECCNLTNGAMAYFEPQIEVTYSQGVGGRGNG